jgi:ribA/ribD-fused uncharacterized protein
MMWRKAMLFGDAVIAEQILAAGHPHQAKVLGGRVAGFDEAVWEAERYGIVVAGNIAKFGQHDDLFLGIGERVLRSTACGASAWLTPIHAPKIPLCGPVRTCLGSH